MAIINWRNAGSGKTVPAGEFQMTLRNGFEPGEGFLKLGSESFAALESHGEVTVSVNFAGETPGTTLILKDLYLTDYTKKSDSSGNTIYTVQVADRRVRWRHFGEMTLLANCTKEDGSLDPASLNAGAQYSWRDLVLACIP